MGTTIGRVGLIRPEDGIVVGSVFNRLVEEDISPVPADYDLKTIKMIQSMVDMYILFLEGETDEMVEVTTLLKDISADGGGPLIAVGEKVDCDLVEKMIPGFYFKIIFERPLDLDGLIARVKKILGKKQKAKSIDRVKKKILIVDDDAYFAGVMRDWLKAEYDVTVATNGMKGVSYAMNNRLDLILLDYEMPVTSGPYVFEILKQDPVTRQIPVVFLTGVDDRESVKKVLDLKPRGYLLKSTSRERIGQWLKQFFEEN